MIDGCQMRHQISRAVLRHTAGTTAAAVLVVMFVSNSLIDAQFTGMTNRMPNQFSIFFWEL